MKFSIRELLLVTVIVALAVRWWLDHSRLSERLRPWLEWEKVMDDGAKERWNNFLLPNSSAPAPNPPKVTP